jgi:hypothetical protein
MYAHSAKFTLLSWLRKALRCGSCNSSLSSPPLAAAFAAGQLAAAAAAGQTLYQRNHNMGAWPSGRVAAAAAVPARGGKARAQHGGVEEDADEEEEEEEEWEEWDMCPKVGPLAH